MALVFIIGILGVVFAILVIVGALMVNSNPQDHTTWGVIILVFSIIGFGPWNSFGALIVGSVLGIIGGALAISFNPTPAAMAGGMPGYPWSPQYPGYYPPAGSYPAQPAMPSTPVTPTNPMQLGTQDAGDSAQGAKFCGRCGASLTSGAAFCVSCGARVG